MPRQEAAPGVQGSAAALSKFGHWICRQTAQEGDGCPVGLGHVADLCGRSLPRNPAWAVSAQARMQAGQHSTEIAGLVEGEIGSLHMLAFHPVQDAVSVASDLRHELPVVGG